MQLSMYETSVPMFLQTLRALKAILEKAAAHAEQRKFDSVVLANSRLFPDMLPLIGQIQIASDAAKGAAARLAGIDPPKFEDTEKTLPELIARIDKTIDFLTTIKPEQLTGAEDRTITVKTRQTTHTFPGLIYLRHWAIPNFFFHTATAYNLLRHSGVEIGKKDFLGDVLS
jgi:uncharacterized protein